ncbi:hypothetical protein BDV59DRAFT_199146 [Aspergillus ambiguus]|uniref:uncharacterized protein n=1 Tax=Aspergillus ambiguus TaxID=176160 RepID=UPI003CCCB201
MTNTTEQDSFPRNRPAKPLPFELVQHVGIFFEEKLYTQALTLLLSILTSSGVADTPTYIPSPQHLAVAATFLVHPSTTTRAKTMEEEEAPSASLQLLHLTKALVGSTAAGFDSAFAFTHFESSRRGRQRRADDEPPTHENSKPLNLDLGQSASVWSRAEDFWHAVGWAFNCSVRHRERWHRWQLWLELMCEVLEEDWAERVRQQRHHDDTAEHTATDAPRRRTTTTKKKKNSSNEFLKASLIFRYISDGAGSYGRHRRILRAIFADGGSSACAEFREVFHNELKPLKRDTQAVKKRGVEVNIDEEQFGDYLIDDEDEDEDDNDVSEPSTSTSATPVESAAPRRPVRQTKRPRRGRPSKDATGSNDDAVSTAPSPSPSAAANYALDDGSLLGGLPALALRQRLLHLLSEVSEAVPDAFVNLEDLYQLFVENIRHLPLPVFQAFVSPTALPSFSPAALTTLCEVLLFRMRESAAPDTAEMYLTQAKLEHCFLPYAASTPSIVDNAKVSIALESLLLLLADNHMLTVTPQLQEAVQVGVLARVDRVQVESKKSQANRQREEVEWNWLLESGERLMYLVKELLAAPVPV